MIRITGGALRGRVLQGAVPPGVRPTAGRVREAVFSMVGQDLDGWSMLDLCGGTGLMALEAASRGASPVVVVERNAAAAAGIRRNLASMGADVELRVGDAMRLPLAPADLVYLDPPFKEPIGPWIARAAPLARRVVVAEARAGVTWPDPPEGFALERTRTYGDTAVALYVRGGALAGGPEADVVGDDGGVVEDEG